MKLQPNAAGIGALDVERLANGDAEVWLSSVEDSAQHAFRTLIISDWSLFLYTAHTPIISRPLAAQLFFLRLHEAGFQMYILQGDELLAYSEDLHFAEVFERIAPRSKADIAEIASQKLPPALRDIAILDYVHLRWLMDLNTYSQREFEKVALTLSDVQIEERDLVQAGRIFSLDILFHALDPKTDHFRVSISWEDGLFLAPEADRKLMIQKARDYGISYSFAFSIEGYEKRNEADAARLQAQLESAPVSELKLSLFTVKKKSKRRKQTQDIAMLVAPLISQLTTLHLQSFDLNQWCDALEGVDLSHIRHLILEECVGIEKLLEKTVALETCSIAGFPKKKLPLPQALSYPTSLKALCLSHVNVNNAACLGYSLRPLTQLISFSVLGMGFITKEPPIDEGPFVLNCLPALLRFEIQSSPFLTTPILEALLNAMPRVRGVTLRNNNQLDVIPVLQAGAFEDVEELYLDEFSKKIEDAACYSLTRRAKALRALCLDIPQDFEEPLSDILAAPQALRALELHGSNDEIEAPPWLGQLQNVRALTLRGMRVETLAQRPSPFSRLIFLNLNEMNATESQIADFLSQFSHLSSLFLGETEKLRRAPEDAFEVACLPTLAELQLKGACLHAPRLVYKLLEKHPKVRGLISDIPLESARYGIPLPCFNFLQKFEYRGQKAATMTASLLRQLLSQAPQHLLYFNYDTLGEAAVEAYRKRLPKEIAQRIYFIGEMADTPEEDEEMNEATSEVTAYSPYQPDRFFHETPNRVPFDPADPPPKSYAQAYIIHRLCQTLQETKPDTDKASLDAEIAAFQKGLCATLSQFFLDFAPEDDSLKSKLCLVLDHDWSGNSACSAELRDFFDCLYSAAQARAEHPPSPLFLGLFRLEDWLGLRAQHLIRFFDREEGETFLYLSNSNHRCALHLKGIAIFFYDPEQPEFYHPWPEDVSDEEEPHLVFQHILEALGPAIYIHAHPSSVAFCSPLTRAFSEEDLLPFIENNGLILWHRFGRLDWKAQFQNREWPPEFQRACLKALFFRNVDCIACLYILLSDPGQQQALIETMAGWLSALPEADRIHFESFYQDSLKVLSPDFLGHWIETLRQLQPHLADPAFSFCGALLKTAEKVTVKPEERLPLQALMQSLDPLIQEYLNETPFASQMEMDDRLLHSPSQHLLLKFESSEAIRSFLLHCQRQAAISEIPCFVIRTPQDLRCYRQLLRFTDATGTHLQPTARGLPWGSLVAFLKNHAGHPNLLLVIDWSAFKPSQVVQANILLDDIDKRYVDQTPEGEGRVTLPRSTTLISCVNPHDPEAYLESDFLRRHHKRWIYPYPLPAVEYPSTEPSEGNRIVDLHCSQHWKALLLGETILEQEGIRFVEGPLLQSVKEGRRCVIKNAPWYDPEFRDFWDELMLHGRFSLYGQVFRPPLPGLVGEDPPFEPEGRGQGGQGGSKPSSLHLHLNPTTLPQCYSLYQEIDGRLIHRDGLLKRWRGQTVACEITREIPDGEMSLFLERAKAEGVTLEFVEACSNSMSQSERNPPFEREARGQGGQGGSDQPSCEAGDNALASGVERASRVDHLIPPTPLGREQSSQRGDFLRGGFSKDLPPITITIDECHLSDLFTELKKDGDRYQLIRKDVLEALSAGQTVILKGTPQPEVKDLLIPLMAQKGLWINGEWLALPGKLIVQEHCSKSMSQPERNPPFANEVRGQGGQGGLDQPSCEAGDNALGSGFERASRVNNLIPPAPLGREQSSQRGDFLRHSSSKDFESELTTCLLRGLSAHRAISVTGPTGGGKTSYFRLCEAFKAETHLYFGSSKIEEWARASSADGKPIVLVVDEANLQQNNWSCFEDLYNDPPSIYVNGRYLPLSPHHRVVLIGNPDEYGGGRQKLPVMQRHPATFSFPALPPVYLREKILAPILPDAPSDLIDELIGRYQHAASFQTRGNEVAATPRDLQTMALAVRATGHLASIYPILDSVLPKEARRDFPSQPVGPTALLDLLLSIRKLRLQYSELQSTGLSALSVVGEPGVGKSHFVEQALQEKGLIYCKIPANWSDEEKRHRLLHAFHAGEIVLFEEINSASFMEDWLNALLSGHDLEGNPPNKPGFTLIATSNPPSQGGNRKHLTTPLERRFMHAHFPPPSDDHILEVLKKRNTLKLPEARLHKLIEDYHRLRSAGKAFSLGDLVHIVDPPVAEKAAAPSRKHPREEAAFWQQALEETRPLKSQASGPQGSSHH